MLEESFFFCLADGIEDQAGQEMIFAAQIDECLAGADGPTGNCNRFNKGKRIVLQNVSVLESADFAFVRVANDEFLI